MFAQFKNVVENFAQQGPNTSNSSPNSRSNAASPSPSASQSKLASTFDQRTPKRTASLDSRPKLSLEDRLKAAAGRSNSTDVPAARSKYSSSPPPTEPANIPLPLSPPSSPIQQQLTLGNAPDPSSAYPACDTDQGTDTELLLSHANASKGDLLLSPGNPGKDDLGLKTPVSFEPAGKGSPAQPCGNQGIELEELQTNLKLLEKRFAGQPAVPLPLVYLLLS
jgi:hypothetical protein